MTQNHNHEHDNIPHVIFKRIATEAKRLLMDKKYEELRRPTDKDYEYAQIIAASLHKFTSFEKADDGPTIDELTLGLTPELHGRDPDLIPDEEYEPKRDQIERSINLLRKMALEAIKKGESTNPILYWLQTFR
jgi:hypothetical protein